MSHTTSTQTSPSPLVSITDIEGRGRALVSSQPVIKAGEIVLRDSPIILYSAFHLFPPPAADKDNIYCFHCFRSISGPALQPCSSCPCCSASFFCSPDCRAVALSSSHSPWVCQALKRLLDAAACSPDFNRDRQVQSRFLVAAYNLAVLSPPSFQILLSLQGDHHTTTSHAADDDTPLFLHSLISSLRPPINRTQIGFSVELTAALLAKDKLNAFGLMEPFAPDKERSVRAYGIYPRASFFNHDCLPNACRFDYVDSTPAPGNTDIIVRAIHDVPQGREICLSYFPVNLKYSDRQRRLKEDYGFTCDCDRCRVEANWSDQEDDEDDDMEDEEEAAMDEHDDDYDKEQMAMSADAGKAENSDTVQADNDFPHAYFFLRYMCNRDNCWGTLAPLPPSHTSSPTLMECNVCGNMNNCEDGDALEQQ